MNRPYRFVLRGFGFFLRLVPRAAPAVVPRLRDEGRFGLESGGAYRSLHSQSQQLFLLFWGAQSFARFGAKGGSARGLTLIGIVDPTLQEAIDPNSRKVSKFR